MHVYRIVFQSSGRFQLHDLCCAFFCNRTDDRECLYGDERERRTKYNERIIDIEKATFVTLVFTTSGGIGPKCESFKFNKRVTIVLKQKEVVINYIRKNAFRLFVVNIIRLARQCRS